MLATLPRVSAWPCGRTCPRPYPTYCCCHLPFSSLFFCFFFFFLFLPLYVPVIQKQSLPFIIIKQDSFCQCCFRMVTWEEFECHLLRFVSASTQAFCGTLQDMGSLVWEEGSCRSHCPRLTYVYRTWVVRCAPRRRAWALVWLLLVRDEYRKLYFIL